MKVLVVFGVLFGTALGSRVPTAILLVGERNIPVVSGSTAVLDIHPGERESIGVCRLGDTPDCLNSSNSAFLSVENSKGRARQCALRTPGCECWQWVTTAEINGERSAKGMDLRVAGAFRSHEYPFCLVVDVKGSQGGSKGRLIFDTTLLKSTNRYLTPAATFSLSNMHAHVWGSDPDESGAPGVSLSTFVVSHAADWCNRASRASPAFPCVDRTPFYIDLDVREKKVLSRSAMLLYYGWPLGALFVCLCAVVITDRFY